MSFIIVIYCAIVVAHVYYAYHFANKITGKVKKKVAKKLFNLKNPQDKKKTLSILTHNIRAFSSLVVYVPNQLYYWLLDVSLVFVSIFRDKKEVGSTMIIL